MVKELKVGDKVYTFKENIMGLDFIASLEEREQKMAKATVRLIARASDNPKLSSKDILSLPLSEFTVIMTEFAKLYGVPSQFDFLEEE